MRIWGELPKTTLKHIATSKYRKHIRVCNFFAIKNQKKLSYFVLQIIGRLGIRGELPKTTLTHIATSKYRKHIKVCNFFAITNHKKLSYFML